MRGDENMWKHEDYGCHGDVMEKIKRVKSKKDECDKAEDKMLLLGQLSSISSIEDLWTLEVLFGHLTKVISAKSVSLSSPSYFDTSTLEPTQPPSVHLSSSNLSSSISPQSCIQTAYNAQRRILECSQSWTTLKQLNHCNTIHIQHSHNYHQFFTESHCYNTWMCAEVDEARQALKQLTFFNGKIQQTELCNFLSTLVNVIETHKRWRQKIKEFSQKTSTLLPLSLRSQTIHHIPCLAKCISEYRSHDVIVEKDEEVTLLDKSDPHTWKVRKCAESKAYSIPSIYLIIIGSVPEAEDAILSLRNVYMEEWKKSSVVAGLFMIKLLNMVLDGAALDDEVIWRSKWQTKVPEVIKLICAIEEVFDKEMWGMEHSCLEGLRNRLEVLKRMLMTLESELVGKEDYGETNGTNALKENWRKKNGRTLDISFNPPITSTPKINKEDSVFVSESRRISQTVNSLKDFFFEFEQKWAEEWRFDLKKIDWQTTDLMGIDECDLVSSTNLMVWPDVYELMTDKQVAETSQVSTSEQEERQTFIITGVTDPKTKEQISFDDAIARGVINKRTGRYVRSTSDVYGGLPLQTAMNEGLIKVERVKTKKLKEKKCDIGLITIRSYTETRPYTIKWVIDAASNKQLSLEQAVASKVIDLDTKKYKNLKNGAFLSFSDALESGFLMVKFEKCQKSSAVEKNADNKKKTFLQSDDDGIDSESNSGSTLSDEEGVYSTYMVHEVLDTMTWKFLTFKKACSYNILNSHTGLFLDRLKGCHLKLSDAIKKGFVKGNLITDPKNIDLSKL